MNAVPGTYRTTAIDVVERYSRVRMSPDQEKFFGERTGKIGILSPHVSFLKGQWQGAAAMQTGTTLKAKMLTLKEDAHSKIWSEMCKVAERLSPDHTH